MPRSGQSRTRCCRGYDCNGRYHTGAVAELDATNRWLPIVTLSTWRTGVGRCCSARCSPGALNMYALTAGAFDTDSRARGRAADQVAAAIETVAMRHYDSTTLTVTCGPRCRPGR